jgi:mono/diheme cytochrome c family protein
MKFSLHLKAIILGTISWLAASGVAFATIATVAGGDVLAIPAEGTLERKGYTLFMLNCAHCHGTDACGDEGPDLHGVLKSDARIASLIKNGKKGEMPKFNAKLSDAQVQALVAFVRSLKD